MSPPLVWDILSQRYLGIAALYKAARFGHDAVVSREAIHGVYPKSDNRRHIAAKMRKPGSLS